MPYHGVSGGPDPNMAFVVDPMIQNGTPVPARVVPIGSGIYVGPMVLNKMPMTMSGGNSNNVAYTQTLRSTLRSPTESVLMSPTSYNGGYNQQVQGVLMSPVVTNSMTFAPTERSHPQKIMMTSPHAFQTTQRTTSTRPPSERSGVSSGRNNMHQQQQHQQQFADQQHHQKQQQQLMDLQQDQLLQHAVLHAAPLNTEINIFDKYGYEHDTNQTESHHEYQLTQYEADVTQQDHSTYYEAGYNSQGNYEHDPHQHHQQQQEYEQYPQQSYQQHQHEYQQQQNGYQHHHNEATASYEGRHGQDGYNNYDENNNHSQTRTSPSHGNQYEYDQNS
jgi:hypothetical protein